jgi:small-conductance mechanosensitive channel
MEWLESLWNIVLLSRTEGDSILLGDIVLVVLLLIGAYIFVSALQFFISKRLDSSELHSDVVVVVKRVSFYIIATLVALTVLSILGIPIGVFAFATGAIAIGVGFGAQNIINNFISGWILIAERPIRLKDFIEIEGAYGTIEQVGTRSTRIHRSDGVHMLVPNSKLLENTVVNWTLIDKRIRTTVKVGVAYGSDVKKVADLLEEVVTSHPDILSKPAPEFIFDDFGDNALIFETYFWCDVSGERSLRAIRSDIRFAISEIFEKNQIIVAFPQRDVHLHANQPLSVKMENGD